jgi:hypothetical protein
MTHSLISRENTSAGYEETNAISTPLIHTHTHWRVLSHIADTFPMFVQTGNWRLQYSLPVLLIYTLGMPHNLVPSGISTVDKTERNCNHLLYDINMAQAMSLSWSDAGSVLARVCLTSNWVAYVCARDW